MNKPRKTHDPSYNELILSLVFMSTVDEVRYMWGVLHESTGNGSFSIRIISSVGVMIPFKVLTLSIVYSRSGSFRSVFLPHPRPTTSIHLSCEGHHSFPVSFRRFVLLTWTPSIRRDVQLVSPQVTPLFILFGLFPCPRIYGIYLHYLSVTVKNMSRH